MKRPDDAKRAGNGCLRTAADHILEQSGEAEMNGLVTICQGSSCPIGKAG